MILIIDNYDSFTYNLAHYTADVGGTPEVVRNDQVTVDQALALKPDAVVLSPGPCTPNEAGICVEFVKRAPEQLPILGVCLGHQSIGQAMGGEVVTARSILHGKISTVKRSATSPLLGALPETFNVVRYHSLAVQAETLPDALIADAWTNDGEIMSMHIRNRPVFGVQFHPESIKTEFGHDMLARFLSYASKAETTS